jgi:signal transduction histidine kinase
MSGAAAKLALEAPGSASRREAFAHLLHALNQPLTGLQCSLELAAAQPRSADEYAIKVREALELVSRMRILVEALREIAEMHSPSEGNASDFLLDGLFFTAADELERVADAKRVHFRVLRGVRLPVRADRLRLQTVIFQLLDSALSSAKQETDVQIAGSRAGGVASVTLAWQQKAVSGGSPFSREELGMLIAQLAWEAAGGAWDQSHLQEIHCCCLKMPLAEGVSDGAVAGESL